MPQRPSSYSSNSEDLDILDEMDEFVPSSVDRSMKNKRLILDLLSRWYWIVLCLIISLFFASYYLSKLPKSYSSTATLMIKQQVSAVMGRDPTEDFDMGSSEGLNTVAERIRRQEILERVAARAEVRALPNLLSKPVDWIPQWLKPWLGTSTLEEASIDQDATALPPPEVLWKHLSGWMSISIRRGTRLIDVTFIHQVPEVSRSLADAVVHEYLAEIEGSLTQGRDNKTGTLLKQSEEARVKLQEAEGSMATYNRALELHQALDEREAQASQLARRYLPKHPKMSAAQGELERLKIRFIEEFKTAISSGGDAAYWKISGAEIEASKNDPETRLRMARQLLLARLSVLRGEINSQMTVFNAMLTRIEESNVNRKGDESSVEVSSYALLSDTPIRTDSQKVYGKYGFMGLATGLLIAYLFVRLDNKFHTVAQLEAETGLPVFSAVSALDTKTLELAVKRSLLPSPTEPQIHKLQSQWDPLLLFRVGLSSTKFAEMFRVLRASVSLLGDESKRKITLFSSALPGEGKSLISSNFALAAAGQGHKTLLIDLDLRKPSIHLIFGFARSKQGAGVTEWLANQASFQDAIVQDVGCENLHVMFSGGRALNPGELLNVSRLRQLFAEASKIYDLIVIDSAPLLAVSDTRVIAPLVDNFCLVVRAEFVPKNAVTRTLELLATAKTVPAGLVFNGYKERRRTIYQNYNDGSSYQYGYSSYHSYGPHADDDASEEKEIAERKKKWEQQEP